MNNYVEELAVWQEWAERNKQSGVIDLIERVAAVIVAERVLTDDLAAALNHLLFHAAPSPADETEIDAVLARYREARQR